MTPLDLFLVTGFLSLSGTVFGGPAETTYIDATEPEPAPHLVFKEVYYQSYSDTVATPASRQFVVYNTRYQPPGPPGATAEAILRRALEQIPDGKPTSSEDGKPAAQDSASEKPTSAGEPGAGEPEAGTIRQRFAQAPEAHQLAWLRYCSPGKSLSQRDQAILDGYAQPPVWVRYPEALPKIAADVLRGCDARRN